MCAVATHTPSIHSSFDRTRRLIFNTQDIDVVVSEEEGWEEFDSEDIKEIIVRADARYYLERSKKREATHRILYCRLPGWATDDTRRVKVDILVPPVLNLPAINGYETTYFNNIPAMPIFDLLVMKTQGWWDHSNSNRADFRAKKSADVSDIFALLETAKQEDVWYSDEADEDRHTWEFMSHALTLAKRFVHVYGRCGQWRSIGFAV